MAGIAVLTQLDAVKVAGMAGFARCSVVLASQHIFGICIVVETYGFPKAGAMAGFALVTKLAFMAFVVVFFLVATNAGEGGLFVITGLVTISALRIGVLVLQRKARAVVVKTRLFPVGLVVAISTFGTQRSFVGVILLVANIALQGRFTVFFA